MTLSEAVSQVKEVVADASGKEPYEITDETKFSDLGLDSLEKLEMLMRLEEAFHLSKIPDPLVQKMTTIGNVINYVVAESADVSIS